jgi:hypothetical protein
MIEVMAVAAVITLAATLGIAFTVARVQESRQRELAQRYLEELRARRLSFVTSGATALRIVPRANGAELRLIQGTCADDAAGLPTAQLISAEPTALPITVELCADRYGRSTTPAMAPADALVTFSTTSLALHWDATGALYLNNPADDPPVRPRLDNLSSARTLDPTPGTQPTGVMRMQPGVLR